MVADKDWLFTDKSVEWFKRQEVGKNRIENETYVNMTYEVTSACENKSGDRKSGKNLPADSPKRQIKLWEKLVWGMMKRKEIDQTGMK